MWRGVFPAVTTKFTESGELDLAEMERCFGLQADAGVDGIIVCGSLGENMTLEPEEKLEILNVARSASGFEASPDDASAKARQSAAPLPAKAAAKAGASGFMVLPGVPYKSAPEETLDACPDDCRSRWPADHGLQQSASPMASTSRSRCSKSWRRTISSSP